ncbi:MAG TPA: SDR family oxidoreductase [Candidatus Acidoferrales bacterium]|jgi:NAD(P)-dependent dehydrogenase (short-subunit alcohol dehydrogenase family)|nr:SDR family oxidoreductase [Candidatus Acidoferrales bacterium]
MKTNTYKVALITGGNRGLGLQTARELGRLGIITILGVRDPKKGKAAAAELKTEGFHAEAVRLDVADLSTHAEAGDHIEKHYGKLDILINNAGVWKESATAGSYAPDSNTSTVPMEILRETFETNFFGTVALTQRLLPLIHKAPAGRIVNVSSILGSLTLHSDPASPIYSHKVFAYDASKTALNAFTVHLAYELRNTPIKVNSAHPGWVKTEMGGEGANLDISEGSKTSAMLATLPDDGPTGGYFHLGQKLPW